MVFLQGDKLGRLNTRSGVFSLRPNDKDIDTDNFARFADRLSRATKTTAIYLARVVSTAPPAITASATACWSSTSPTQRSTRSSSAIASAASI